MLPNVWRDIVNSACNWKGFLTHLGKLLHQDIQPNNPCCGWCTSNHMPLMVDPPVTEDILKPLWKGTHAYAVLEKLTWWCMQHANHLYGGPDACFPMPSELFMPLHMQWQLTHLYCGKDYPAIGKTTVELQQNAPSLMEWEHGNKFLNMLYNFLDTLLTVTAPC